MQIYRHSSTVYIPHYVFLLLLFLMSKIKHIIQQLELIINIVHSMSGYIYCRKKKDLSRYLAVLQQPCQMLKAVAVEKDGL